MNVGLFFGTFNPFHAGHLMIGNYMVEFSNLEEVWYVITPLSPFKKKSSLLSNHHRLALVNIAVEEYPKLKSSSVEFKMPQPNYTINTLVQLEEDFPSHQFYLIMGEDNLKGLHKWKNSDTILENYEIYVYPRISKGVVDKSLYQHPKIHKIDAPIVQISSTFIRRAIKEKKDIRSMFPCNVWQYIDEMNFYK